jgi:two-component system response regulator HydG
MNLISNRHMRILIVDDEPEIISMLSEWLSDRWHEVVGITGGAHAVDWVNNPKFDVVLLDIKLPDVDGLAIVSEVIKTGAKVIVMSGLDQAMWMPAALNSGASGCVAKPIKLAKLQEILEGI